LSGGDLEGVFGEGMSRDGQGAMAAIGEDGARGGADVVWRVWDQAGGRSVRRTRTAMRLAACERLPRRFHQSDRPRCLARRHLLSFFYFWSCLLSRMDDE